MRSSRLLCYRGRVPPLFFTVWGFVNLEAGCCCSRRYFADDKWVLLIQSRPKCGSCSSCRRPADDLQTPSLRRPKWVLLIQSRPKWDLLVLQKTCKRPPDAKPTSTQVGPAHPESTQVGPADDLQRTCRRQAYVDPSGSCSSRVDPSGSCSSCRRPPDAKPTSTQVGPAHPESTQVGPARTEFDPAVPGPSRRRSFDSPQRSSDHSSRQGSDTPPRKRRRLSGNSSEDEDHRLRIANNGTINRMKRIIFVLPRWIFF